MKIIRKLYFAVLLLSFVFLAYECGDSQKNSSSQGKSYPIDNSSDVPAAMKGNPAEGKTLFTQTCSACHGTDAKGLPHLGKDLTTSSFIEEKTDKDLVSFIEQGRQPGDPLNTTGVAMPPKGGNPALTEQQIIDIVSFMRELHK